MESKYPTEVREQIKQAMEADKMMRIDGWSDSEPSVVKLKNNGNMSRQIYQAVGHQTLQSAYNENGGATDSNHES